MAQRPHDPEQRAQAVRTTSYTIADRYILFVLSVGQAFVNQYIEGHATVTRWSAAG